jgi:hypothetical protein
MLIVKFHNETIHPYRNAYAILVRKPDGNRPLRRSRHRWENNIKIVFIEGECQGVDCIHIAHSRELWR